MDSIKCPVCGNPGIPDYKKEDVACPHCGSDLSIYRSVAELSDNSLCSDSVVKKYKLLSIILPIIAVLFAAGATYILMPKSNDDAYQAQISKNEQTIVQLRDSVSILQKRIQEIPQTEESNYFEYYIVQNDGPWRIVNKLYGSRSDWKEVAQKIAEDNGIWDAASKSWKQIHPGQTLKINKPK